MAGTGGDQRVDAAVPVPPGFKFVGLVDKDVEGDNNLQYPRVFPLSGRKRSIQRTRLLRGGGNRKIPSENGVPPVVFFAASRPTFNTTLCETQFFSSLWAVEIFGGSAYVDLDGTGVGENVDLGQSKVTGIFARGSNLYVSESGGLGSSGSLSVYGDGEFEDGPTGGAGAFSLRVMIEASGCHRSRFEIRLKTCCPGASWLPGSFVAFRG